MERNFLIVKFLLLLGFSVSLALERVWAGPLDPWEPEAGGIPSLKEGKMILMASTPQTYVIGEETGFYDDGGPEGNISDNYEGYVVFTPQEPGKVIQLDLTALEIQNYPGLMSNNDILKIYNGQGVDENNLHTVVSDEKTLLGTLPMRFRSTAEDGSLTFYFKKVASLSKAGFEATVSQYRASDMRFVSANQFADTRLKALQGDSLLLLGWNIRTEDLLHPLSLQAVDLDFSESAPASLVDGGKIYFMGQDSVFDPLKAVETGSFSKEDLRDGKCSLVLDASKTGMREGSNYFYLEICVGYDAVDGNSLRAELNRLSLTNGSTNQDQTALPLASGSIAVENTYYTRSGENIKYFKNQIGFEPTPTSYSAYDYTMGEQVVRFIPVTEERFVQIRFSMFDLYDGGYYGSHDIFEIYSGDRNGALLWEYDGTDATRQGPDRILRSHAADGSMTIVFKPSSFTTGEGFRAEVAEYEPAPLDIDSASGFQAFSGDVMPGTSRQPLLGLRLDVFGTLETLKWTGLTAHWKEGCESAIEQAALYLTETSVFDTNYRIAQSTVASATTSFNGDLALEEGSYWFWLVVDTKPKAESGTVVDASWSGLTTSRGRDYAIADADPDGAMSLKMMYNLQNGKNEDVLVDGLLMFYDDGGPEASYTMDAFNGKVTFNPVGAGKVIRMKFLEFETYSTTHVLSVYSGSDTLEQNRIGAYSYRTMPEVRLISQSPDGKMSVQFIKPRSTYGSMPDGWAIEVEAVVPSPLALESVRVSALEPDFVGAYSQNVEALMLRLEPVGDTGTCRVDGLVLDLGSTDVPLKNLRAYFLGTDTVFSMGLSEANFLGQVDSVPVGAGQVRLQAAEGSVNPARMPFEQPYYMVVMYDLGEAGAGDRIEIGLDSVYSGSVALKVDAPSTLHVVQEGIHGDFIVGVSAEADFESLGDAIRHISSGVDGPVNLRLENGTYDEVVVVPAIPGLSENNFLTIESQSGCAEDVLIASDDYDEYLDFATLTRNPNEGVFNLDGASYVRLRNLSFSTSNLDFPSVVHAYDAAHHIEFSGLRVYAGQPYDYNSQIDLLTAYASTSSPTLNCSYFRIEDCYFEGGDIGLNLGGAGVVALGPASKMQEVEILDNQFVNQGSKAMYLHEIEHFRVVGNTIRTNFVYSYSYDGMDLYRVGLASEISSNKVELDLPSGKYASGIYMRPVYGTAEAPVRVFNNVVNFKQAYGNSYGFELDAYGTGYVCEYVDMAYNTVRLGGDSEAASSAAFFVGNDAAPRALYVVNNLFQNQVGGYVYRMAKPEDTAGIDWERNGLYTTADTVEVGRFARMGSAEWDFGQWSASVPGDKESLFARAGFLSDNMLGLRVLTPFDTAVSLAWVPTDIFGVERPSQSATLGAYEFEGDLEEAPVMAEGYPQWRAVTSFTADMAVKMSQSGHVYALVLEPDSVVPADSVLAHGRVWETGRNQESLLRFEGLEARHTYRICFVLENYNGVRTDVMVSDTVRTDFLPTAVSTFEDVALGTSSAFEDGTARFAGFTVVEADALGDARNTPQGSYRALALADARIDITNTDTGLNLTGFFYRSPVDASLKLSNGRELALPATPDWHYFNLRDKGRVRYLEFSCTDSLFIDDFSGQPLELQTGYWASDTIVKRGTGLVLASTAFGGVQPYIWAWTTVDGDTLSRTSAMEVLAERNAVYKLDLRDGWNRSVSKQIHVVVLGGEGVADFEDLALEPESNWHGETDGLAYFYSGSYRFTNSYMQSWDSWSGFAYANQSDSTYIPELGYGNQYKNAAGGGALGSASYGVVFDSGVVDLLEDDGQGVVVEGCYATNNVMLLNSVLAGDSYVGGPFSTGDYFRAVFRGIRPEGDTAFLEYYLADYRDADTNEHYALRTWEWVDLSVLGAISRLQVSFEGSRYNQYGLTLPAYMALDKIGAARPAGTLVSDTLGVEGPERLWAFEDLFSLPGNGSWSVQVGEPEREGVALFEVMDGALQITPLQEGDCAVELEAVRNGRSAYVTLRVHVKEDVSNERLETEESQGILSVYPVPATRYVDVAVGEGAVCLSVFDLQGRPCFERKAGGLGLDPVIRIPVEKWTAGVYLLRVVDKDGRMVSRTFVVR